MKDKIIRTPLDPDITYSDDPLRMMRAIRFATQLNYTIEEKSLTSIAKNKERIKIISKERISDELNKIILAPVPSVGFKLLFDTGSIIIDDKGKQALTELAKVLKSQPEINIAVEGHTDNQKVANLGQIKDNWDLSVLRATSVVRYLTEVEKIDSKRLTATGKGQYQPIAMSNSPEDRSKNRRIEIVLSPKLDELYDLIK